MSSLLDWLVEHEPSFRKTRLPSLYADLTVQKASNPEGYAANVTAWQAALTRAALAGQLPTEQRLILQSSDDLLNSLASPRYGRPSGLGSVIDECVRNGKMIDLKDFTSLDKSIYSRTWIPSPWSVLQWSLRRTGLLGSDSYDVSGRLRNGSVVLVQALEEISKQLLVLQAKKGEGLTDRVMSREEFSKNLAELAAGAVSDQDVDVLLRYLSRDKHTLSHDSKTIKFKPQGAAVAPEPISQEDTTIASLKSLIASLTAQTSRLDSTIASLQSKAQFSVKSGNKQSALSALRSKKLAEHTLQQRTDTLHQLEDVYAKIEQAADQVAIVAAMEASAGVLKTLNHRIGGVERVDSVMDDLREEMGKVGEVGQVLQEPLDSQAALGDETEVEDELEAMEKEEAAKRETFEAQQTRKRLEELERVPAPASQQQRREQKDEGETNNDDKILHDEDLVKSTEKLQRMSLDPPPPQEQQGVSSTSPTTTSTTKAELDPQRQRQQQQPVAETAS